MELKKMVLSDEVKKKIEDEFNSWVERQYNGKDKKERQKLGQFYTPPVLTIQMLEKFDDTNGTILDPTAGSGNLLAAAIMAGFDPKKVYAIELDPEIYEHVLIPRLTGLGVPLKNIKLGDALKSESYDFSDIKPESLDDIFN